MLFLVIQKPKRHFRGIMSAAVVTVEAKSKTGAVREAAKAWPDYISKSPDCLPPYAVPAVGFRGYV